MIATIIPNQASSVPPPVPQLSAGATTTSSVVDLTSDSSNDALQIKGSRTVSCKVDIIETSTVQALMDRILQHYLQLNLKQHVIGLQYNNDALNPNFTLDMYGIPVSGATMIATVHSSDTGRVATTGGPGKSVNASSFATVAPKYVPKGTIMTLSLRRSLTINGKVTSEEIPMKIGALDPLQVLVDQYRQQQQPHLKKKITLQFDGETMILQRTPQQYDMENDDLIDVIVT